MMPRGVEHSSGSASARGWECHAPGSVAAAEPGASAEAASEEQAARAATAAGRPDVGTGHRWRCDRHCGIPRASCRRMRSRALPKADTKSTSNRSARCAGQPAAAVCATTAAVPRDRWSRTQAQARDRLSALRNPATGAFRVQGSESTWWALPERNAAACSKPHRHQPPRCAIAHPAHRTARHQSTARHAALTSPKLSTTSTAKPLTCA